MAGYELGEASFLCAPGGRLFEYRAPSHKIIVHGPIYGAGRAFLFSQSKKRRRSRDGLKKTNEVHRETEQ
jgi:hypothetical protein